MVMTWPDTWRWRRRRRRDGEGGEEQAKASPAPDDRCYVCLTMTGAGIFLGAPFWPLEHAPRCPYCPPAHLLCKPMAVAILLAMHGGGGSGGRASARRMACDADDEIGVGDDVEGAAPKDMFAPVMGGSGESDRLPGRMLGLMKGRR
jgi:hypothetical protein